MFHHVFYLPWWHPFFHIAPLSLSERNDTTNRFAVPVEELHDQLREHRPLGRFTPRTGQQLAVEVLDVRVT